MSEIEIKEKAALYNKYDNVFQDSEILSLYPKSLKTNVTEIKADPYYDIFTEDQKNLLLAQEKKLDDIIAIIES